MAVRDVETVLKAAVEETLTELVGDQDIEVTYHVSTATRLEYCPGDEQTPEPHFAETIVWRLNLYVTHQGRFTALNGMLPYTHCHDGDTQPMILLTSAMWENFTFSVLMLEENLDNDLEQVAREAEKEA